MKDRPPGPRGSGKDELPRTHKWRRREGAETPHAPPEPRVLHAYVPGGEAHDPARVRAAVEAALRDWPVALIRLVGKLEDRAKTGRHPGRWLRTRIGWDVDKRLCDCDAPRCTRASCTAWRLLGRHGHGRATDAEGFSPFVLRASSIPETSADKGAELRCEVVLAGAEATSAAPRLLDALLDPPDPPPGEPGIDWRWAHALCLDGGGELRWQRVDGEGGGLPPGSALPLLPLDRLPEPRVRAGRLTLSFLSATPIVLRGESGQPSADLSFVVDRMTRSLGAWMGRTGHHGPRLPVDDLLRAAASARVAADHHRIVEIPTRMLGLEGVQAQEEERTPSMTGAITWTGDFEALAPLLRAVHYVGMGPGRQWGLGELGVR
jgi:hypothetical protein